MELFTAPAPRKKKKKLLCSGDTPLINNAIDLATLILIKIFVGETRGVSFKNMHFKNKNISDKSFTWNFH